jgi:hypothetical protein
MPSLSFGILEIARYSPILNQSTGWSNEGFTWAFTHRITVSLSLLFYTNGSIYGAGLTTCPATKRNGDPCGRPLKDYEYLSAHFDCGQLVVVFCCHTEGSESERMRLARIKIAVPLESLALAILPAFG